MVSPLDPSQTPGALAAALKALAAAAPAPAVAQTPIGPASPARAEPSRADRLRTRLQRLDGAAPVDWDAAERRRARLRVLIEGLLSDEFGASLAGDARFQALVDEVLQTLTAHPALEGDLQALARRLSTPA